MVLLLGSPSRSKDAFITHVQLSGEKVLLLSPISLRCCAPSAGRRCILPLMCLSRNEKAGKAVLDGRIRSGNRKRRSDSPLSTEHHLSGGKEDGSTAYLSHLVLHVLPPAHPMGSSCISHPLASPLYPLGSSGRLLSLLYRFYNFLQPMPPTWT